MSFMLQYGSLLCSSLFFLPFLLVNETDDIDIDNDNDVEDTVDVDFIS